MRLNDKNAVKLKARASELKAEGKVLLDAAEAAKRDVNADEDKRLSAIEAELEQIATDLEAAEKATRRRQAMAGDAVNVESGVVVGEDRERLDPRAGFNGGLVEFARSVRAAHPQTAGGQVDPRLAKMYAAPTGYMREGGGNEGYMVPPEFRDRIWELVFGGNGLVNQIDAEPTSQNQVNDLTDETTPWGSTGVKAYWRMEASQMTGTRPVVKPRSLVLNELYAFVLSSDELLEDAPRLGARLEKKAAEAIDWKLDDAIKQGDGVGKPLGYMNGGCLVTQAAEASQTAATVNANNVAKMYSRLLPQGLATAQWRVNQDVLPQLMTMTIANQPIWLPPSKDFKEAPGGFLLGRPVVFDMQCQALGTVGDIQLIDPKGYYGLKKAGGVKFASSIHLYFDYGLQAFRWTFRFGGQPHLSAAVTPPNSANTQSHFVVLATRS